VYHYREGHYLASAARPCVKWQFVLIVCGQTHTLLHDGSGGVMLQIEQVQQIHGHRSYASIEVQAPEVRHGLKTLLPHWICLIPDRKKRAGHHDGSGEAVLTQGGECDEHHLLDCGVGFAANNGAHPWLHQVEGYHHASLAYV
jgi:hypothetical protein